MTVRNIVMAAAGNTGEAIYVEDVFSTYLYTGTGATQTITNGIDLAGEGGMVWIKDRVWNFGNPEIFDTQRGATKLLTSAGANQEVTISTTLTSFNTNGFALGTDASGYGVNRSGDATVSWTFRKAEKFFDVVTYTGDGVAGRQIPHNLGSVPGVIIVKSTSNAWEWVVYHRSLGATKYMYLNDTASAFTSPVWNDTAPTSTHFTVNGDGYRVNNNGQTFVAYLFAHDAGGFGDSGSDNVISCGSFTAGSNSATGSATINLGWEPQWILTKNATGTSTTNWQIYDNMRGLTAPRPPSYPVSNALAPNTTGVEADTGLYSVNSTGFVSHGGYNNGDTIIYIAIRRGPMQTPTLGTSVFSPVLITATQSTQNVTSVGFSPDLIINGVRSDANYGQQVTDRLRGVTKQMFTEYTSAESTTNGTALVSLNMNGFTLGSDSGGTGWNAYTGFTSIKWSFRRAPGFFDVVCYTGNGANPQTLNHNLGIAPELIIVKQRDTSSPWTVYSASQGLNTGYLNRGDLGFSNNSNWGLSPTSSAFSVQGNSQNASGGTYVAYLFATVAGVSKVGSYTGTGTTLQVNCGFTSGARFVMIKRTDSTGDWYVWDSARGIVAGNDPYLLLNSADAEVTNTDYVDTFSSGFEISSTAPAAINANGGTFIFLAIA